VPLQNLLSIRNLVVTVQEGSKEQSLVDWASIDIPENRIVALVGGSGSGKTTTGLSVLRLLPLGLKVKEGEILWQGNNLLSYSEEQMRAVRGKEIGMVFQEPLQAFNPIFSIGYQIEEVLEVHTPMPSRERHKKALELLDIVGIADPKRVAHSYPHQLSGGMRQRSMIAQALAGNPRLIIADEPTSSLDVTLQARIIDLFKRLKNTFHLSILLITHDLGMVSDLADEVVVMNQGRIVEQGLTKDILAHPQQPYTRQLVESASI
jgi:ABC-type dipeptide/oligopeptide/nickel transport system ATPase component